MDKQYQQILELIKYQLKSKQKFSDFPLVDGSLHYLGWKFLLKIQDNGLSINSYSKINIVDTVYGYIQQQDQNLHQMLKV